MVIWEYAPELKTMTNEQLEQAIIDEGVAIGENDGRLTADSSASLDLHFDNIEVLIEEVRRRAVLQRESELRKFLGVTFVPRARWWLFGRNR